MPKQRPPSHKQTQYCSFCGEHKQAVPLIVTSNIKPESACCCTCALAIVQQTQQWAYGVFKTALELQAKAAPKVMVGKGVGDAVKQAIEKG